jgi:hypothetical protein
MKNDVKAEHRWNANSPRTEIRLPSANATLDRFQQFVKHQPEMISIDAGMQIDDNNLQFSNVEALSIDSLQSVSNVALDRHEHEQKHFSPIVSIEDGIQNDVNEPQFSNADLPRFETRAPTSNMILFAFEQP